MTYFVKIILTYNQIRVKVLEIWKYLGGIWA